MVCAAPAVTPPKPTFERAVNAHLRAYESCARGASRRGNACAGHLDAARGGMVALGYSPAQAARHVDRAHEEAIAPRLRAAAHRQPSPDATPAPVTKAAGSARQLASTVASPGSAGTTEHFAEWSLCLEKTKGEVLAYPVAPDADVEATASAITRACNGYAPVAHEILVASGRTPEQAREALVAFTGNARQGVLRELQRRAAKAAPRRDTASARAATVR
jgi:hypothetical protein